MLREAQEELKNLRNKTLPLSTPRRFHSLGLFPMVSEGACSTEDKEGSDHHSTVIFHSVIDTLNLTHV